MFVAPPRGHGRYLTTQTRHWLWISLNTTTYQAGGQVTWPSITHQTQYVLGVFSNWNVPGLTSICSLNIDFNTSWNRAVQVVIEEFDELSLHMLYYHSSPCEGLHTIRDLPLVVLQEAFPSPSSSSTAKQLSFQLQPVLVLKAVFFLLRSSV